MLRGGAASMTFTRGKINATYGAEILTRNLISEDEFPGQKFKLPSQCIPQHEVAHVFASELQVSTPTVQGIWSHPLRSSILGGACWKLRGWESEKSVNTYEDSAR